MPDLFDLVKLHGSVRKLRVKVAIEHSNGFIHEVTLPAVIKKTGLSADDVQVEMMKAAELLAIANIVTDNREKRARSLR